MKYKSKLDIYSMMIVSKYFKTTTDFIRLVQVCHKFKEIPDMFHFNPVDINERSSNLFPKIETQYFYNRPEEFKIPEEILEDSGDGDKPIKIEFEWRENSIFELHRNLNCFRYVVVFPVIPQEIPRLPNGTDCVHVISKPTLKSIKIKKDPSLLNCVGVGTKEIIGCVALREAWRDVDTINLDLYPTEISLPSTLSRLDTLGFAQYYTLKSINIPKLVNPIPKELFMSCRALSLVVLQGNDIVIQDRAFFGCSSLKKINLEEVVSVGSNAFFNCVNLSINALPPKLKSIGHLGFFNCRKMMTVRIPDTLTFIGASAFGNCVNLDINKFPTHTIVCDNKIFFKCDKLQKKIKQLVEIENATNPFPADAF